MPSALHMSGGNACVPAPAGAGTVCAPASGASGARATASLSTLHRTLKKVARAVDKLDVHNYLSLKKVIEQKVGRDVRISCGDMEALRLAVVHLRVAYGKLEQYLTHYSKRTMGRAAAGSGSVAGSSSTDDSDLHEVEHATVVQQAEQLKFEVVGALETLVCEIERHRSALDFGPGAGGPPNALSRFLVHYKYYSALMQHCRSRGLSWLGDVVADYLATTCDPSSGDTAGSPSPASGARKEQQQQRRVTVDDESADDMQVRVVHACDRLQSVSSGS